MKAYREIENQMKDSTSKVYHMHNNKWLFGAAAVQHMNAQAPEGWKVQKEVDYNSPYSVTCDGVHATFLPQLCMAEQIFRAVRTERVMHK